MNSKQIQERRKLLGIFTLSSGALLAPRSWVKPVVNAVVLPTHAQASMIPLMVALEGVVDGTISTRFTVTASASGGSAGASLSYVFAADQNCILVSQSGASAVIERGLVNGDCEISVTVSDGSSTEMVSDTSEVTGGPPGTP